MRRVAPRNAGCSAKSRSFPSGRFRARYADPDGKQTPTGEPLRHSAPHTFDTRQDAEAWLADERRAITNGTWTPPSVRLAERRTTLPTMTEYAPRWLAARKVKGRPLADRTRDAYQDLLDRHILPTFGTIALKAITPADISLWYDATAPGHPTTRARAYSLLSAILRTAADPAANNRAALIPFNPCAIQGGGTATRATRTRLATADEVAAIVAAMPERHRLLVLLADGCGLRFGELAELRRPDVDTKAGIVRIRRAVARSRSAGIIAKAPKSDAGIRDLPIPPHLLPAVRDHLLRHAAPGTNGLLFPGRGGGHLSPSAFYGKAERPGERKGPTRAGWGWYEARRVAGRPDLRFHDLRHGALTEAARNGATLAEVMALGGHSTSQAAMRYQAASSGRLAELARKRSEALGWTAESAEQ